jgi:hypothetical protein
MYIDLPCTYDIGKPLRDLLLCFDLVFDFFHPDLLADTLAAITLAELGTIKLTLTLYFFGCHQAELPRQIVPSNGAKRFWPGWPLLTTTCPQGISKEL